MPAEKDREGGQAEGPLRFHSSREERLAVAGAQRENRERRSGSRRRDRTLLIVFVDILLFLLLAVLLVRFLYSHTSRARLEGYSVNLRGLVSGEVVYATVTVNREGAARGSEAAAGDGRIYLRLSLSREASDGQFLSAGLPGPAGGELVLRESIASAGGRPRTLYAEVRIGQVVRRLSCGLQP